MCMIYTSLACQTQRVWYELYIVASCTTGMFTGKKEVYVFYWHFSVLPKNYSRHDKRAWFGHGLWSHESFPFPHQRKICAEGLQGQQALSMLGRTLLLPVLQGGANFKLPHRLPKSTHNCLITTEKQIATRHLAYH